MKWLLIFIVFCAICGIAGLVFWRINQTTSGLQVQVNVGDQEQPAAVYLNDVFLDNTPLKHDTLKAGSYTLSIRPMQTGLAAYQMPITLTKGVRTYLLWKPGATLETSGGVLYETRRLRSKTATSFTINTIPDHGIIRVDDGPDRFSPTTLSDISAGEHTYEVTLPSYEAQRHTIQVLSGYEMIVTIKLARQGYETPTP